MASRYEHPFRILRGGPVFPTQHEARDFVADYQAQGFIRPCAHAVVRQADHAWEIAYAVRCDQDSFQIVRVPTRGPGDLSMGLNGCPEGCRLYQPRWRATLSRWRQSVHPVHWFERQPWQVKVALNRGARPAGRGLLRGAQGSRHPGGCRLHQVLRDRPSARNKASSS